MASNAVKRTISLPATLAREIEEQAQSEHKSFSAVVQAALREMRRKRLGVELREIQGYWSRKAKEKGVLSERDLKRYLES